MKSEIEIFLDSVPTSGEILRSQTEAVALFAFFLTEVLERPLNVGGLSECFSAAHLRIPKNMSDTMTKSGAFVRNRDGWNLHRDAIQKFRNLVQKGNLASNEGSYIERNRTVMVIYGRDEETRRDMFSFLRAINLNPIEWNVAVGKTCKASPYVGEILDAAFAMAQAFLVLLTPDEKTVLRPELQKNASDGETSYQPRPNVILEAGMALANDQARTVIVSTSSMRSMSDLDGRHLIYLNNSAERRNDLIERLRIAGCKPQVNGTDWIHTGNFERFSV